jgi:glycosyltransferase involved in cell wall biosynthesis
MEDAQVYNHLMPIARHPLVSRVWIVRSHRSGHGDMPGCEYLPAGADCKVVRWLQMWRHCRHLAQRPEVRAFVSFNPFPYGLISALAASRTATAVHFGFVGRDWYRHMQSPWAGLLYAIARRADFFTATGKGMRAEMIERGLDADKIAVLPHSIDLDRYPVADPGQAQYACIFVGKLIERKRVDIILRAFAEVLKTHPREKLCIVGIGPMEQYLKQLTRELGIEDSVDFVGFTHRVVDFLARARIDVIASWEEGFPFSLVEGMCCGLVPVSTPVGTVRDFIRDGSNGLIFSQNDVDGLANAIKRLLDDPRQLRTMRENVLQTRDRFSYDQATAVWDPWLRSLV